MRAAKLLSGKTNGAVLVKGGHRADTADDLLVLPDGRHAWLRAKRIATGNTHGTGCTLSSAIASGLAQGNGIEQAVRRAKGFVRGALSTGLDLGQGSGPPRSYVVPRKAAPAIQHLNKRRLRRHTYAHGYAEGDDRVPMQSGGCPAWLGIDVRSTARLSPFCWRRNVTNAKRPKRLAEPPSISRKRGNGKGPLAILGRFRSF